jgi:hypothetical protein
VYISHGSALDAITAICSPLNPARTDWAGQPYQPTQVWGGSGGRPKQLRCQTGHAVHRLKAWVGPWGDLTVVKGVGLLCGDLDEAYYYEVVRGAQSTVTKEGEVKCKDGDWATGLFGGSGNLVDRLGLVCNHIVPVKSMKKTTMPVDNGGGAKPVKSMKKAKLVTVVQAVDVCRAPDDECDEDTRIAVLEAGTPLVRLQEPCANDRCHVKWPDGEGWVYDGPGYDSLRY